MEKRNWKILYSNYTGMEKKAVDLVSEEVGRHILRDKGVYSLHVLACEKVGAPIDGKNIIVIGRYEENELIRTYIKKEEIPKDGYVVRVIDNPENTELKIALITGDTPAAVFYGAVDFVDDYFVKAAKLYGSMHYTETIFCDKLSDYYNASAPTAKTRSLFLWGHTINDYHDYIKNAARMRINQLVLWNLYCPINADEVVEFAHEYGIEILWGYSWGWQDSKVHQENPDLDLDKLKDIIVAEFNDCYAGIKGDGIYFQSFTETVAERIANGRLIADVVVDLVNRTTAALLEERPEMHIQFGLHATSVKERLEYIAKVDPRVEIVWEDCGAFPFNYAVDDKGDFEGTWELIHKILNLRENGRTGLYYKGQVVMDWRPGIFAQQSGPYILGRNSEEIIQHDRELHTPMWRYLQSEWMEFGYKAYEMTRRIVETSKGNVNIGMAGTLSGGIWYPTALCAQMLWDCSRPYEEFVSMVQKRHCVTMA